MKLSIKLFLSAIGLAAFMTLATSCNKGYGCPTDFSVDAMTEAPASVPPSC